MKKLVYFCLLAFLFSSCSGNKNEQNTETFLRESMEGLANAVNLKDGGRLESVDTLFTQKIGGTDSIFMIGYKFVIVAKNARKLKCEYIYENLRGHKNDLLIFLSDGRSIEDDAEYFLKNTKCSYHEALFFSAAKKLSVNVK